MFANLMHNLLAAMAEMKNYLVNLPEIPDRDYALVYYIGGKFPEGAEEQVKALEKNADMILKEEDMKVGGIDNRRSCLTNFRYVPPKNIIKVIAPCYCCYPTGASIAHSYGQDLAMKGKLVIIYGSGPSGLRASILLPFSGECVREMEY